MKAIFKDKKQLVLNSADSNEQIVLEDFIKKAKKESNQVIYTKLVDINGDIDGMAIEIVPADTEPSTPIEDGE